MSDPLFRGSRLKIERANEHINDLYLKSREFNKIGPYSILVEDNPETGDSFLQISADQTIPEGILLIVGDAVHNLACALDFAISDMEFATRKTRDRFTKFPFHESREKLVIAVNGGLKEKTTKAVIDHIVDGIQPYPRGRGEPLWGLHILDIEDKHRLLIARKDVAYIRNIHCKDGADKYFVIPEWAFHPPRQTLYPCIGHANVKIADKGKATFGIVFGDGMPFYGRPILPTLRHLSHFVSGTIDSLERVFLASRNR
jgi:hypothetical protein